VSDKAERPRGRDGGASFRERLEAVERGERVTKKEFAAASKSLRVELLTAQHALLEADFGVIVLIAGDDRPGCEALVDRLHEWLDARRLLLRAFPADDADAPLPLPLLRPFWRALPPHGRIAIFLTAWPIAAIAARLRDQLSPSEFETHLEEIARFERELTENGTLLVKLWIHRPLEALKKYLKKAKKNPDKVWDVEELDQRIFKRWEDGLPLAEALFEATDQPWAPWRMIDGQDDEHRDLTAARALRDALRARLVRAPAQESGDEAWPAPAPVLSGIDLSVRLEPETYDERLNELQGRLARLSRAARHAGRSSVLVFEGPDAAGKGGAIRRLIRAMAARDYRVIPIAAPDERERARHYLWRFWTRLPAPGAMTIFDRSWYGRVLVERVEGFAGSEQWQRAYEEIVAFERQLVESGIGLCKFWLQIDLDEQLRRFEARKDVPYKRHKITPEDYRNRARWDAYQSAADDMLARTDRPDAPWTLVAANDKHWARIRVLEVVCESLEAALE
jgi:polyphosphate:AMP phosphotransferase